MRRILPHLFQVSDIDLGLLDDNEDYAHTYTINEENISQIKFNTEEKEIKHEALSIEIVIKISTRKMTYSQEKTKNPIYPENNFCSTNPV